jgi:regulatory protein
LPTPEQAESSVSHVEAALSAEPIGNESEFDQAREIALRRLTAAPKTRRVLTRDLLKRGVKFDVANEVVNRLAEVGLIDDAAFANAWVSSRHVGRGLARRALRSELRLQGVDDEVVSEAVESLSTDDEYARAKQLVERKLRVGKDVDSEKQIRRITGMLQRKGYGMNMISAVIKDVLRQPA